MNKRIHLKTQLVPSLAWLGLLLAGATNVLASSLASVSVGPQIPDPVTAGSNATYTITVTRTGNGNLDVYLTCANLPAGATASFAPYPVTFVGNTPDSQAATLTIITAASTPAGIYPFLVIGDDGASFNTVTNTATLIVGGAQATQPPPLLSIAMLADGTAKLTCNGAPGGCYWVQATPILCPTSWTTVATNVSDAIGWSFYIDRDATNFPMRFYRLVTAH